MYTLVRKTGFIALMVIVLPMAALAETTKDFVRAQAAKAEFATDVAKVNRYAADMFRVASYAVLRMTHEHWSFDIDQIIANSGQTYAWKINSNAEDANYDIRRFSASLTRNEAVTESVKSRAKELIGLVDQLAQYSFDLAEIYDTGDVRLAGDHYREKIVPVFEAIRLSEASITTELAREIKLDAAKF